MIVSPPLILNSGFENLIFDVKSTIIFNSIKNQKKNMKLYESAFLIHLQGTDLINLEMVYPPEHNFTEELKSISSSVCPSLNLPSSALIFSFNLNYCLCHVLYFIHDNMPYEIIILSKTPFAFLFHSFLNEVFLEFKNAETTPRMRFQYVLSYLSAWENETKKEVVLSFPSGNMKWELDLVLSSFAHYSPLSFFSYQQCLDIFNSIISGIPVLIIAPNARVSSLACFSIMSFFYPLQFAEPYALWLRETDPRFVKLVNNDSNLMLVGSPCEALESLNYFQTVVKVRKCDNLNIDSKPLFHDILKPIMDICVTEMDELVLINPWSDIIDAEFDKQRITHFMQLSENNSIDLDTIIAFSHTKTFKLWRRRIMNRPNWRESLLSCNAHEVIPLIPKEKLSLVQKLITQQIDKNHNDLHVVSVLKVHQKLIDDIINA